MAEHNELGNWEELAVSFCRKRISLYQLDFQKPKLISLPKKNTLAIVEVKPAPH
jgi:hypothetical protein